MNQLKIYIRSDSLIYSGKVFLSVFKSNSSNLRFIFLKIFTKQLSSTSKTMKFWVDMRHIMNKLEDGLVLVFIYIKLHRKMIWSKTFQTHDKNCLLYLLFNLIFEIVRAWYILTQKNINSKGLSGIESTILKFNSIFTH